MEGLNRRIEKICAAKEPNEATFLKRLNMPRQTWVNYKKGRMPAVDFVIKVLGIYKDVSAEWLMRGVGQMLMTDHPEQNMNIVGDGNNGVVLTGGNNNVVIPNNENSLQVKINDLERIIVEMKDAISARKETIEALKSENAILKANMNNYKINNV